MTRILAALAVLAALVLAPAGQAVAADALVVQIKAGQVTLNADGTVTVPLRVRCSPPSYAFEIGVGVRQGSTIGAAGGLGGPLPSCTGKWEQRSLTVTAQYGSFVPGTATITAYVAVYDPVQDVDVIVEDAATVRL